MPCIAGTPADGETIDGKTYDGKTEAVLFPGTLPDDPDEAMASAQQIRFVRFQPPALAGRDQNGSDNPSTLTLPHIQLDRALQFLLADKLS